MTIDDIEAELASCQSAPDFAARAAARGIALTPEQIARAARPDPAGALLLGPAPAQARDWPAAPWHPAHVSLIGASAIDWAHFGHAAHCGTLDALAFRGVLDRPFNRLFRRRMTLEDFAGGAREAGPVAGFIFHMSRCGSTLAARMLGRLPDVLTLSEVAPVNDVLLVAHGAQRVDLVRAIVAAYADGARPLIVHFDAWHALALPLIRAAFPAVPFVFLHRDPVEVLVSHARLGGTDLYSRAMPMVWNFEEGGDEDELTARALGKICESAARHLGDRGLAVDYRQLPGAVVTKILPHFGIAADVATRERLMRAAERDAKFDRGFTPDTDAKQRAAGEPLKRLAARHIRF